MGNTRRGAHEPHADDVGGSAVRSCEDSADRECPADEICRSRLGRLRQVLDAQVGFQS